MSVYYKEKEVFSLENLNKWIMGVLEILLEVDIQYRNTKIGMFLE